MIRIVLRSGNRERESLAKIENTIRSIGTVSPNYSTNEPCRTVSRYPRVSTKRWASTSAPNETGPSYFMYQGPAPLWEKSIGQVLDQTVNRYPKRTCIVSCHENVRLTFAEVRSRVDKFAAGLKKLGLKRGDRVAIWGPNSVHWYLTFQAVARAGLLLVGINPAEQPSEIEYCLKKVGVKAAIASESFKTQNYAEILCNAKSRCPSLEHVIIYSDKHVPGTRRFSDVESLANRVEVEAIGAEQSEISPYDAFSIQFTSGTTGRPKATVLAHRSIVNNGRQIGQRLEFDVIESAVCLNVPLFHAFGVAAGTSASLCNGATIVLPAPTFKPDASLEAIVREKCTSIYGTPTMWIDLMNAQEQINAPIREIHSGVTGGSPASPEMFKRIQRILRVKNIGSIYGLTEATGISFQSLPGDSEELRRMTVGHVSDHTEVQVVDANGVPVPFGTPGELWMRGYNTMLGYWDDQENTKKTLTEDGWLKSGDQFVLESNGYGRVVGRLKDVIIRGGENIFPREIEDFLQTHPSIVEAQVFGVTDERLGEEVYACIRLRKGANLSADAVREFCKGQIAHFKIPRQIHFVDDFPKTTSGKVKKRVLRESFEVRNALSAR